MGGEVPVRYRRLGRWGLRVSEIALGGWTTFGGSVRDPAAVREIMLAAYEAGVNYFDIADVYANGEAERVMGAVLGEMPRHTVVVASKVFFPMSDDPNDRGLSRKHVHESIDRSLERLGMEYVDLYFAHRFDPDVPLEEVVWAFSDLVDRGKVLYWGTSEWPPEMVRRAVALAREGGWHPPVVEQPEYSLVQRRVERELFPLVRELGTGLVVWSPLGQGLLTGKYDGGIPEGSRFARLPQFTRRLWTETNRRRVVAMREIAEEAGLTRAQLALAWVLAHPEVSAAIVGATSLAQLEENLGAAEVDLPAGVVARLDDLFAPEEE
ncbi:MAG: aldo/keto reductase, partial [Nitrospirae bacterium]